MSPPEAPMPDTALGWPRYSSPQPDAPAPPSPPRPRHSSLPLPTPFSEPRNTLSARETWIAGSPAMFVPQPVAPTALVPSSPAEKLPTVSAAEARATPTPSSVAANSETNATAEISERGEARRRADTSPPCEVVLSQHPQYPPARGRKRTRPSGGRHAVAPYGWRPYGVSALTSSAAGRMSSIRVTPLPAYSGPESSRLGGPSAVGGPGPKKGWLGRCVFAARSWIVCGIRRASGAVVRLAVRIQRGPRVPPRSQRRVASLWITRCGASGQASPKSSVSTVCSASTQRCL